MTTDLTKGGSSPSLEDLTKIIADLKAILAENEFIDQGHLNFQVVKDSKTYQQWLETTIKEGFGK